MAVDIWNLSTLCRCCHADGDFRSLHEPYTFKKNVEIYSEMLKETFLIDLINPPVTPSNMICEDCVYLVRSAWRFKRQVEECERKFKEYCLNELNAMVKNEEHYDDCVSDVTLVIDDREQETKPGCGDTLTETKEQNHEGGEIIENYITEIKKTAQTIVKTSNEKEKTLPAEKKEIISKHNGKLKRKKCASRCIGCRVHFCTEDECNRHMDVCKLVYRCNYCHSNYPTYISFIKHLARHIKQTEFTCDYCCKIFRYKKTLLKHIKAHMGLVHRLQCDLCSTQCNDSTQLRIHKKTVHENLRPYACDLCDETFKANKRLKIHYRSHTGERPFQCEICNERFISREYMLVHGIRKHKLPGGRVRKKIDKNVKNHICHICGKTLGTKYILNRHIENRHGNIKRFPCTICGKKFVEKGTMLRHVKSIHNPDRKKAIKVPCTMCKMKVIDIDKHMDMHLKRPHACNVCEKRFSQRNALNRHVKDVHQLIRPHVCVYCGAAYVIQHRLKMHIEKHHKPIKEEIDGSD